MGIVFIEQDFQALLCWYMHMQVKNIYSKAQQNDYSIFAFHFVEILHQAF
jgi:hypothetical protein